ncbi:L,D-transpeptidase scaffold domain-containing protein, partial [Muricoccus nepalensis]
MKIRYSSAFVVLIALAGCAKQAPSNEAQPDPQTTAADETTLDATPPSIAADALKAAASDSAVKDFYAKVGWHGLWSDAATAALDQTIGSRVLNGLDRIDFGKVDASMSPAQRDVARTKAALGYASALAGGAVDPTTLHEVYTIRAAKTDVAAGLQQALQQNQVAQYFAGLAPQDDDYRRLAKAYVGYSRAAAQAKTPTIA